MPSTSSAPGPAGSPWPGPVSPMLAVAGDPPPSVRWREWKYDGHRCLVQTREGGPRLVSRGGRVITARFPEVAAALAEVLGERAVVLDGELVAPGEGGLPDFERLQARVRARATPARVAITPATFVAFDLLALDGVDLTRRPLRERRARLDGLGLEVHPRLLCSPVFTDVDPGVLLDTARRFGMEGVVSKAPGSIYQMGRRSKAWVKSVIVQRGVFTVAGVAQGRARDPGVVGSLLLARPGADGGYEYVGEVGTGWTRAEHAQLTERLAGLSSEISPVTTGADRLPAGARFVRPELQGVVAYREHRPGRLLRHPSWKGLVTASP